MPSEWLADPGTAFLLISQYARLGFAGMLLFVIAYQVWAAGRARRNRSCTSRPRGPARPS